VNELRPVSELDGRLTLGSLAERPSLREEVADRLRAALVAGQMRAGVIYSVPALAEQFGVSATPVREAMLDLVNDGLVESVRNKGFRVTEPTDRELDEITHLRALIEVPTVADLATYADASAIEALRPLAALIVSSAEAGDLIGYIEADRSFHLQLLRLSGNARLVQVVDELRARTRLHGLEGLAAQGKLTTSAQEHEQILDALLARDAAAAGKVMARHIAHIRGIWAARPEGATPPPLGSAIRP
jgi:DNA-binding GntR family transcriptional regulator